MTTPVEAYRSKTEDGAFVVVEDLGDDLAYKLFGSRSEAMSYIEAASSKCILVSVTGLCDMHFVDVQEYPLENT